MSACPHISDDQRRSLRLLARGPHGCTEAIMLAHGFKAELLAALVRDGLATKQPGDHTRRQAALGGGLGNDDGRRSPGAPRSKRTLDRKRGVSPFRREGARRSSHSSLTRHMGHAQAGRAVAKTRPGSETSIIVTTNLAFGAIAQGVHSADVVINILARQRDPGRPANILTPAALTLRHAPIADCARYA
jgi:hypothetical protein